MARETTAFGALAGLFLFTACGGEPGALDEFDLEADAPVIMIVADTLAASHLGFQGYELDTSPFLDDLSSTAFVFDGHSTQCNATFPSMTSILTGLYPRTHRSFLEVPQDEEAAGVETMSLAERFQAKGYYTIAIWSHPFWVDGTKAAVSRGWDLHSIIGGRVEVDERNDYARGSYTNERLFEALETYEREGDGKPLFLWLHYFDPHTPYDPSPEDRDAFLASHLAPLGMEELAEPLSAVELGERMGYLQANIKNPARRQRAHRAMRRALYDAEIRTMDHEIRAASERLQAEGLWDEALVIFMADHGENVTPVPERREIAFTHTRLFEDVVRTPLVIRFPSQEVGRRIEALSQNIDVLPTLAELFRLPTDPPVEGLSLVPVLLGLEDQIHDQVFIESRDNVEKAVRTTQLKYIDPGDELESMLYQWKSDPLETDSTIGSVEPAVVDGLSALLDQFKPVDLLCGRFTPGSELVSGLTVQVPLTQVADAEGAWKISADQHGLEVASGRSADETDMRASLLSLLSPLHFEASSASGADLGSSIYLGQSPISRTAAIPGFFPSDNPAPENPILTLSFGSNGKVEVRVNPESAAKVEVELRFAVNEYGRRLTLVDKQGFGELERLARGMNCYLLTAEGEGESWAILESTHPEAEVQILTRIDGAWPPLDRTSVNGRAVDLSRLRFTLPWPSDGRVVSELLSGPPEDAPPGALLLWMEGTTQRVEVDKTLLDPAVLKELQKLGYAR